MSDHKYDDLSENDHDHEEHVFDVTDDDGNELEMVMVYSFEAENQSYAVLLERDNPEAEGVIFRIVEENGDAYLTSIEDDEEWSRVVSIYNQFVEQEE